MRGVTLLFGVSMGSSSIVMSSAVKSIPSKSGEDDGSGIDKVGGLSNESLCGGSATLDLVFGGLKNGSESAVESGPGGRVELVEKSDDSNPKPSKSLCDISLGGSSLRPLM